MKVPYTKQSEAPSIKLFTWATKDVAKLDMVPEPVFTNEDEGYEFPIPI